MRSIDGACARPAGGAAMAKTAATRMPSRMALMFDLSGAPRDVCGCPIPGWPIAACGPHGMGAARDPVPFSMPLGETEVSVPGLLLEIPQHGTGDHLYSRWLQRGVKAVYEGRRMGSPCESVISARNSAGHSNSLPAGRLVPVKQLMFAQGFKRRMLANLIRAGLATAQRENIKAGSLAVGRVRITEAGRRALEG
jgi:hypothetical protein